MSRNFRAGRVQGDYEIIRKRKFPLEKLGEKNQYTLYKKISIYLSLYTSVSLKMTIVIIPRSEKSFISNKSLLAIWSKSYTIQ